MASSTCGSRMRALVGQLTGSPRIMEVLGGILVQRHGFHRIIHPRRHGLGLCSKLPTAPFRGAAKLPLQGCRPLRSRKPLRGDIGTTPLASCRSRLAADGMPSPDKPLMLPAIGSRQATENRLLRPRAAPPQLRLVHVREKLLLARTGRLHSVRSFAVRSAMRRMRPKPAHISSSRVKATRTLGRTSLERPRRRHQNP